MNQTRHPFRKAGLSMVEVMIASFILAAILSVTFAILANSSAHVEASQTALKLENDARETLNAIMKDLRNSSMGMLKTGTLTELRTGTATTALPAAGTPFPGIQFKVPGKPSGYAAFSTNQNAIYNLKLSYYWELDVAEQVPVGTRTVDNRDNDNNGLIDEGVIVKREAHLDAVGNEIGVPVFSRICSYVRVCDASVLVADWGLRFSTTSLAGPVSIQLALEKADPKNRKFPNIKKMVESSVELRNK